MYSGSWPQNSPFPAGHSTLQDDPPGFNHKTDVSTNVLVVITVLSGTLEADLLLLKSTGVLLDKNVLMHRLTNQMKISDIFPFLQVIRLDI